MRAPEELQRLAGDPDEEVRYLALQELPVAGAPAALELLLGALRDPSWRVRKVAVERLAALPDAAALAPRLLLALGAGDDAGARNAAAETLVRIGAPVVPALLPALSGADPELRKFAADVLGEIGDARVAAPLSERLQDEDRNVRAAAAEALGKVGGGLASAALLTALSSGDHLLQVSALEALGKGAVLPPLAVLRRLSEDRFLRRSVFRLLGRADGPDVIDLLCAGLAEPARGTREAALAALAVQRRRRTGPAREQLAIAVRRCGAGSPELPEQLAAALGSHDLDSAEGALFVLAWLGRSERAAAMAAAAQDDRLRDAAIDALLVLGPAAAPPLRERLDELAPEARGAVLAVLGGLGDRASLPALLAAAAEDGGDEEVRLAAIGAIGSLGAVEGASGLCDLLGEGPPISPAAAAALLVLAARERGVVLAEARQRLLAGPSPALIRLLGKLGGVEDVPALKAALSAPSPELRAAAAAALGDRQDPAWAHALCRALADEAASVRAAAARAIGGLGQLAPAEGRAALAAALRDEEPQVVAAAAAGLGGAGAVEHAGALRRLLADIAAKRGGLWPPAAIATLLSLGQLGEHGAVALAPAFQEGDPEVVKEACAGAGPGCERLLLGAARHPRWDVRRAAVAALARTGASSVIPELEELARGERDPAAAEALADALGVLRGGG